MKKLFPLLTVLFCFSMNAFSQELPEAKNLTKLNSSLSGNEIEDDKPKKPKEFFFSINPYLWTIAMSATIGVPNTPAGYPQTYEVNKSFSDALKVLKMAFMAGGRFKYKKVSLYYDIVYANLKNFGATVPQGSGLVSANTTFKEFVTDLSIGYPITTGKNVSVDAYAGTRIWSLEQEITLIPTQGNQIMRSSSKTWVDPIIGVHANFILAKQWFSYLRSDVGGFGSNSDYTFQILGGFGYRFNPNWNTTLGLKYLGLNYDKDGFTANQNQYGFTIGFGYNY